MSYELLLDESRRNNAAAADLGMINMILPSSEYTALCIQAAEQYVLAQELAALEGKDVNGFQLNSGDTGGDLLNEKLKEEREQMFNKLFPYNKENLEFVGKCLNELDKFNNGELTTKELYTRVMGEWVVHCVDHYKKNGGF